MAPLRPNNTQRSQGIPVDDDLEAVITTNYVYDEATESWIAQTPSSAGLTDDELRAEPVDTTDSYTGGEVLADQTGVGNVLTFTFTAPVDLVWVMSNGGDTRADPFGGNPNASTGIPCLDQTPNPMTIRTSSVKVFAAADVVVSVWGYRYA